MLALLRHLEDAGFAGAPRMVCSGFAEDGRETVVRDGQPVALIDFEFADPVDEERELAEATWLNAQLHDDDIAERAGLPDLATRARRASSVGSLSPMSPRYWNVSVMTARSAGLGFCGHVLSMPTIPSGFERICHEALMQSNCVFHAINSGLMKAWCNSSATTMHIARVTRVSLCIRCLWHDTVRLAVLVSRDGRAGQHIGRYSCR